MSGHILTLNAGSSSIKFAVFEQDPARSTPRISGKIAGIGRAPEFTATNGSGPPLDKGALETLDTGLDHEQIIALFLSWLRDHRGGKPLLAVGHRVVHGGLRFTGPTRITQDVLDALEGFSPLAPLHQPHNLAAIRAVAEWQPGLTQIACFDTSFHRSQDRVAELFALPRALLDEGVIRYGFHGLSYEYIASVLPDHIGARAQGRVIVAHLGNGASMCAMKDRKSRATSMGFTALDGLMMGRRCGTLDPGVVLYLMQARGMTAAEVETLLYRKSGLLGVSDISNNMQVLTQSDSPNAREAIDLFCYRAASVLAGLVPAIDGLDALVFTAGIGENASAVRKAICDRLAWLGIALDEDANAANAPTINTQDAPVKVLVIPTNEEIVVANGCRLLLA